MIQRIQTLYLLLIVALGVSVLFLPLADMIDAVKHLTYQMKSVGVFQELPEGKILKISLWSVSSFAGVIPTLAFITIFQYKNRTKQIRLCVINFLFIILFYLSFFINLLSISKEFNTDWSLQMAVIFPLIAGLLNYLAIGSIGKDEALVKSMDRLR